MRAIFKLGLSTKVACIVPLFHILGENQGSTMTTPPGAEGLCDRPHGTPELWNVLYESYRAEQTNDHVVLSSKIEISHVRLMKDYVRMFSSGDSERLLVNVQTFDVIVAFEILDVVARSTCYIEQGITRARFVSPNYAMDLLGFFLIVLVRVDLVVVSYGLSIHGR